MRLNLLCYNCEKEKAEKAEKLSLSDYYLEQFANLNDSGLYKFTCEKGHNSLCIIDNINFEILFDYSLNAIVDNYHREAVASFTSSMERFFEFAIKVILKHNGNSFEQIDLFWKTISKQSERQLGSYLALYSQSFKEPPKILTNNSKETPFRNKVIHNGYIPEKEEAAHYGNVILEIIETSLIKIKSDMHKATLETFNNYGYLKKAKNEIELKKKYIEGEIDFGIVEIMTTIMVKNGREQIQQDLRNGKVGKQVDRIKSTRNEKTMSTNLLMKLFEKKV